MSRTSVGVPAFSGSPLGVDGAGGGGGGGGGGGAATGDVTGVGVGGAAPAPADGVGLSERMKRSTCSQQPRRISCRVPKRKQTKKKKNDEKKPKRIFQGQPSFQFF